jgi:hypothetical protein
MPRKNKRKIYNTGKSAVFYDLCVEDKEYKIQCIGCAFAGISGSCTTSNGNGKCLKSLPERQQCNGVAGQRKTDALL